MKRILTALVALPILLFTVWSPIPYFFVGLAAIAALLGLAEFYKLASRIGGTPSHVPGFAAALLVLASFVLNRPEYCVPVIAALTITSLGAGLLHTDQMEKALISGSATVLGVLYVALLAGFLIGVRMLSDVETGIGHVAPKLITTFLAMVMLTDTGAYYTGRTLGKHKLSPKVSPGKTIEGAIGGLIAGILAGPLCRAIFFPEIPLIHSVILGAAVSVTGQIGDLVESMLKRGSQVKDSSNLLPGHGGMLDRLDSILFAAPLIYYYSRIFLASR